MVTGVERTAGPDRLHTDPSTRPTAGRGRVRARLASLVVVLGVLVGGLAGTVTAGQASAIPEYTEPNLVTTLRCDSANPFPFLPKLPVWVDVFNQIQYSADGLPGPTIALIASDRGRPQVVEYTMSVRVTWRNLRTGRTGEVTVPSRATTVRWQVDLHPGAGPVAFTIHQKIGAMAFVPMVNPQYSTCRGRASA